MRLTRADLDWPDNLPPAFGVEAARAELWVDIGGGGLRPCEPSWRPYRPSETSAIPRCMCGASAADEACYCGI